LLVDAIREGYEGEIAQIEALIHDAGASFSAHRLARRAISSQSNTVRTGTRVPVKTGVPLTISGSVVMGKLGITCSFSQDTTFLEARSERRDRCAARGQKREKSCEK